ncbi:trafficking kinesin-binding protein milt [Apis cerana cerana]|uniref:Trafficking kinesin-binding protein milt n=1 Tax=Apis cerana cerana TaxID=94128 RepID=A0A2A3E8A3_APICC|nr:trafficking kinesin-binding protein milt [Apis cerana cerana]
MKEGETISFVATASKLAAVEDAASKGPEASIRSKVSPKARAALQALRSPRNRISTPLTPPPTTTKDVETITGNSRQNSSCSVFYLSLIITLRIELVSLSIA